jgi:TolA-binding protein
MRLDGHRFIRRTVSAIAVLGLAVAMYGADDNSAANGNNQGDTSKSGDAQQVQDLKQQLAEQQKQIDELRELLIGQKKQIDGVAAAQSATPVQEAPAKSNVGDVATIAPIVPPLPAAPAPTASPVPPAPAPAPQKAVPDATSPLQIPIGGMTITPVGFMDLTNTWRSTDNANSLQTNFGNFPYNNAVLGRDSDDKISAQNSRIGFRTDGTYKDFHVLGYFEGDFVGTVAANNTQTSSNSVLFRLRQYYVDVRKGHFEVLGGQAWSLIVPNRDGMSPLPANLFYSQVVDVNYLNGLVWGRIPGFRFIYHANDKIHWGIAAENADQYFGGSGGGGTPTLPAAAIFATNYGAQVDANNGNDIGTPALAPDIISKLVIQPNSMLHFEVGGVEGQVKLFNQTTNTYFTKTGGGGFFNFNVGPSNLKIISNNYWDDGEGRYIFGLAPDFIIRPDGSPSLMHSGSTTDGVEARFGKTQWYAYYGGTYVGRDTAIDANGKTLIGYGFTGSANSQNRAIQEITTGFIQTLWNDGKYGAIQLMGQYAYFVRNPWYVAVNAPKNAHEDAIWFNLRYVLPGTAPTIKY